jgi:hypothetical protein
VGPLLADSGELETDHQKQASILNTHFASKFTEEDMSNLPNLDRRTVVPKMEPVLITEQKVLEKIQDNLKQSQQCAVAASKGNQILGQIRSCFTCFDKDTIIF